jgi:hypothetical protein
MPCLYRCPWCDHPCKVWWSVEVMKLLIMQSSPVSHHFIPLRSTFSPQRPVLLLVSETFYDIFTRNVSVFADQTFRRNELHRQLKIIDSRT